MQKHRVIPLVAGLKNSRIPEDAARFAEFGRLADVNTWCAAEVRNVDAWYAAFDVKPGAKVYLPPDQRVKVW